MNTETAETIPAPHPGRERTEAIERAYEELRQALSGLGFDLALDATGEAIVVFLEELDRPGGREYGAAIETAKRAGLRYAKKERRLRAR